MARYEIRVLPSAAKDTRNIPTVDLGRILERIASLQDDPRPMGSVKLASLSSYRIRQGNYRIVYKIDDAQLNVVVLKIGHRRDIYR